MKTNPLSTQGKKDRHFVKCVLQHYESYGRHDLPWRKSITPYTILVSEVMLQQTQVSRVVSKFNLWMKMYPTLASLSKATLRDVLVLWQGLGYQRRAKALYDISHKTAYVPQTFHELLKLPGVGTYTASAICAFAYDVFAHPMLETNIRTALIETFYKRKKSISDDVLYDDLRRLESISIVRRVGARRWYYALMDFGASLKERGISHNEKSTSYTKQNPYKGSLREMRAQVLFAIAHKKALPKDVRLDTVLRSLERENYISKRRNRYEIRRD